MSRVARAFTLNPEPSYRDWRAAALRRTRATVSTGPPAPNGTTKVIGRDGKDCANATPSPASVPHASAKDDRLIDTVPSQALRTSP